MEGFSLVTTKNGTQSRAAESEPLLNDVRRDWAVDPTGTLVSHLHCAASRRQRNHYEAACCQLEFRWGFPMPSEPSVTIIVPALNEEKYIRQAINSLIPAGEEVDYELIVLDGGSTDCTPLIIKEMMRLNPRIRLETNPTRYQSAAVNRGAKIAKPASNIIIRADSHAEYPPDFVAGLVRELRERDVVSVVVPMGTRGKGFLQRGIAAAQNSRLGNGGALHRTASSSRYVEHGHHAAFERKTFLAVGGYDESFTHNEDAELDIRLGKSGARIWLCSELAIKYFPRSSFAALARHYFNHGFDGSSTLLK